MKRLWILALLAVLLPVALMATREVSAPQAASDDGVRPISGDARAVSAPVVAPSVRLLHNSPARDPHAISDALVADIDGVPPGERIQVTTYWLESARLADALVRAHQRGATVRMLIDSSRRGRTPEAQRVIDEVRRTPGDGSWVRRDQRSAATDEGILHEKIWRFSRTGAETDVVVVGSWNAAESADAHQYAAMWRVSGHPDIYDAFEAADRDRRERMYGDLPVQHYRGAGWAAYFLPLAHRIGAADPSEDPVLQILRRVPADPRSEVRIVMYSMWDERATWLAADLARISRGGGRVVLVAGPTVDQSTRATVTAAGGRLVPGCYPDGTTVHGKDMALRYVVGRKVRHWTWVGSDNWTSRGLTSSQAVLGIEGEAAHRQFVAAFAPLARRTDGLGEAACEPRKD